MQKKLYLLSRQHVTVKMVISLKIQQIIDLLQRVTFKDVDFMLMCDHKDVNFTQYTTETMLISDHLKTVKILISHWQATIRT